jgi:hypothetical protein
MYRSNVLWVFVVLFIFALGIYFFQNKISKWVNISTYETDESTGVILQNTGTSINSWVIYKQNGWVQPITNAQLKKECENFLNWKESIYLKEYAQPLVSKYNKAIEVLSWKNEYLEFKKIFDADCSSDDEFCQAFKTKNITMLSRLRKDSYEYVLFHSLIDNVNYCDNISDISDKADCHINFSALNRVMNASWSIPILDWAAIDHWYMLNHVWKEAYIIALKKEFMGQCLLTKTE